MGKNDMHTDVLIIGAGPIGATYARFLVQAGLDVTMIDAGAHLSKRPGMHLQNAFKYQQQPNLFNDVIAAHGEPYSIAPTNTGLTAVSPGAFPSPMQRKNFENPKQNPNVNMSFAAATYAVGGMFTHWTGCAPTPPPMERTPLIPNEDWAQMLPIANKLFNVHTDAFSPSFLNEALKNVLNDKKVGVENLPMGAEKRGVDTEIAHFITWTGADTILGPLVNEPEKYGDRFRILAEHRAEALVRGNEHQIEYAVVRDLATYTTKKVVAKYFIVTAGSFLTPRLLWQSDIRYPALGRYLNENTVATTRVVIKPEVVEALRAQEANPARREPIPIALNDPEPMLGFSPTPERPWHSQIHRAGRYNSYNSVHYDVRLVVDLVWFGMVEPRRDNRIKFSRSLKDRFGMPQITVNYSLSTEDAANADAMMQNMIEAANLIGTQHPDLRAPIFGPAGASLHLQGTYRMGDDAQEDANTSVVNTYSQAWGIDNLYLGGLGVIPNKMADNPTLTACAMAVRSVSRILNVPLSDLSQQL